MGLENFAAAERLLRRVIQFAESKDMMGGWRGLGQAYLFLAAAMVGQGTRPLPSRPSLRRTPSPCTWPMTNCAVRPGIYSAVSPRSSPPRRYLLNCTIEKFAPGTVSRKACGCCAG